MTGAYLDSFRKLCSELSGIMRSPASVRQDQSLHALQLYTMGNLSFSNVPAERTLMYHKFSLLCTHDQHQQKCHEAAITFQQSV